MAIATAYYVGFDEYQSIYTQLRIGYVSLLCLSAIRLSLILTAQKWRPGAWVKADDIMITLQCCGWVTLGLAELSVPDAPRSVIIVNIIVFTGLISSVTHFISYNGKIFLFNMILLGGAFAASAFSAFAEPHEQLTVITLGVSFILVETRSWSNRWRSDFSAKDSEHSLQELIDAFPGGISEIQNSRYLRVNEYVAQAIGLSRAEIVGRAVGFQDETTAWIECVQDFERQVDKSSPPQLTSKS
jgi:hypothetical protein